MEQPIWESLAVPQKIKYRVTIQPRNSTHTHKEKTYVHAKICKKMFIAVLFEIVKKGKRIKCRSTEEWKNKMLTAIKQNIIQGQKE